MPEPPKVELWDARMPLPGGGVSVGGTLTPWRPAEGLLKAAFILFLLLFALNTVQLVLRLEGTTFWRWSEALFLLSAAAGACLALAKRLPLQNVIAASLLIVALAGFVLLVGSKSGVPFGPVVYGEAAGPPWIGAVPWSMPVLWLVMIVNGRNVARLIMRPWRKTQYYGLWVIGLTGLLAIHLDLALEPFATLVKRYWLWRPTTTSLQYYMAPWVNFLAWFATTVIIMGLTLPWMINKQPVKRAMDYQPLLQWMLIHAWLATGNFSHGLAVPGCLGIVGCLLTAFYAIRGARW